MAERDDSGQPALPSLRALLLGTATPLSDALSEWENDYRATEADPSLSADQRIALWMDQDHTLTKRVRAVPVRSLADAVAAAGQYLNLARQDITAHAVPEAVDLALAEGLHAYLSELRASVEATEGSSTIPAIGMTFMDAVASIRRRWREAAEADDTESDKIAADAIRITEAVLKAEPRTPADAIAQLELLADPDTGMAVGGSADETDAAIIRRVYAVLAGVPSGIVGAGMGSIPPLGMTLWQAEARGEVRGRSAERERCAGYLDRRASEWDATAKLLAKYRPDLVKEMGLQSEQYRRDAAAIRWSGEADRAGRGSEESTLIPALGMTFTQAADRIAANHTEHLALPDEDRESADRLVDEWNTITLAVSAAAPQTITDALAVLRIASHTSSVLPYCDVHAKGSSAEALFGATLRAAAFLSGMPLRLVQNYTQSNQADTHFAEQWERYTAAAHTIGPDLWPTIQEWVAERRRLDEAEQPGKGRADYTAYNRLCTELISAPANSFTGIAIKVAVALGTGALHEFGGAERQAIAQAEREAAGLADPLERELAELLTEGVTEALERLTIPSEQPAAFPAAVAAFRGEASMPLAIPDTPTEAMLQAGAAVGGCSPETVRAAFAAMVEAYRREAA